MDICSIESNICVIFKKRANIDFKVNYDLKGEKLLGAKIRMPARELVLTLFDIQREYNIIIPEKIINDNYFDTFNHIIEIIKEIS